MDLYAQDDVCVVDDELIIGEINAAGARVPGPDQGKHTNMASGSADRVNLVEMFMWSINTVLNVHGFGCVVYQHVDGRMQLAFGRTGNLINGTITGVFFRMNKAIARLFGKAQ